MIVMCAHTGSPRRDCRFECRGTLSSTELEITCTVDGSVAGIEAIAYNVNGGNKENGNNTIIMRINII